MEPIGMFDGMLRIALVSCLSETKRGRLTWSGLSLVIGQAR